MRSVGALRRTTPPDGHRDVLYLRCGLGHAHPYEVMWRNGALVAVEAPGGEASDD
jgi:hypothetical protein